ncbi:MAG: PEP-CTERM sorting domain-containing protein [Acidobacteria bacterium]|nr:PEP-CTERM sorting domain-containing protein [Acidobacteriota bacterium]
MIRTLAIACIGGTFAGAATFDFTSGTLTKVDSGITMTAAAFSLPATGIFETAQAAFFSGIGTGICNSAEGPSDCGFANHHIENSAPGGVDFFLLKFSTPVDPVSMVIQSWTGSDRDVTMWVGSVANPATFTLAGLTLATMPAGLTRIDSDTTNSNNPRTVSIGGSTSANILVFGARIGQTDDFFKLVSLSVNAPLNDTATPEPGTLALIGGALVAIGAYRRQSA